ncbi:MAG: hypothetical protein WA003_15690 [Desulfuromonadaceae bacterium]
MQGEINHFFYSEKQAALYSRSDNPQHRNIALIEGNEVVYTCCSDTADHGCLFGDEQPLGVGVWLKCDGHWNK